MDRSAEEFENHLDCSICLRNFVLPKILPCQHTFCLSCLIGAVDYGDHGIVKCPECRAQHQIPNSGFEGFPTNVILQRFLGFQSSQGNSSRTCDNPPSYEEVMYGRPKVEIQPTAPIDTSQSLQWIKTSKNRIPPSACIGGSDKTENFYIGRAAHKGSLTPGKVHPSHKTCFIAWGGREHSKDEYEILVGKGSWVHTKRSCIPPGAFLGGHTENRENLYIGRVSHEGTVTIGKVQPSHGVCYIPYAGKEIAFENYEIFVYDSSASRDAIQSTAPIDTNQSLQWIKTSKNRIPHSACIGGSDKGENLYIGRATHKGSLTPGKVHPSHKTCFIAWGGREHSKDEYEILVGKGSWVHTKSSCIPPGAFLGGHTENRENLYIGRVSHEGTVTIGKVQASHGVCYIPYDGKEIAFENYEIFVA